MIKPILLFCGVALAYASMVATGFGQDAGLYDNAIDPSKAYVRVVVQDETQASIAGAAVSLPAQGVSGYVSVPAGSVDIGAGDHTVPMTVEAGTYYTFALAPEGFVQFKDPSIADPSKAEVLFYNLTSQNAIDLFVPAAKTNAMSAINAGTSQSVELRAPLTLGFEARSGSETIAAVADVALERKQAVSLFLKPSAGGSELVQVVNSFADTK